jgi:hypothetical protein
MSVALQDESAQIRSKMASLRRHMHKDARRIVANTNQLLDWKEQLGQFPKALIAAGLLVGFAFVPGRKVARAVTLSQQSPDEILSQRKPMAEPVVPEKSSNTSVVFRMLTGVALSGASFLLRKAVESYFTGPSKANQASPPKTFGSH